MLARPFEGGCQCGAVRYRVDGPVQRTNFCHCRMCQKHTGAPVAVWVTVPAIALRHLRAQPAFWRSSPKAERGFCASCGTPLFWRSFDPQRPGESPMIDIAAGTLDDPSGIAPTEHIWCESAMPWLKLADGLPRYPRTP